MIEAKQTKGCDRMSQVYGNMFNFIEEIMQDEEKLKDLSPLDFSALGIYIGKFVEQEINSSVIQLMRQFCCIDMPDFYCKRCPDSDIDADVKYKKKIIRLNEQKDFKNPFSLQPVTLGDAYYAFLQLKEEDEDGFFEDYSWLDQNFVESWRNIFRLRNKMAHIGEIVDEDMMKQLISFFQRFLSYMPRILELKKELAPEGYYESLPEEKEEKEEEKPYWVSTDHRDKPYASLEVAQRFCELTDWPTWKKDFYERMDERKAISDKYYLDAMIFVGTNGKKGLKDCLGKILVPANYDGFYFLPRTIEHNDKSVIAIRNGKYVVAALDGSGKELTSREYDEIKLARNDHPYMPFIYRKDGALSWGFMSNKGEELTECIIDSYQCGLDSILYESGELKGYWQFGYIVLPPIYDNIDAVNDLDDPLVFTLNGVPGYVHHDGSFIPLAEVEEDESEWYYFCEIYT